MKTIDWHYGPQTDPNPAAMWHDECGGEVLLIEGGYICCKCGEQQCPEDCEECEEHRPVTPRFTPEQYAEEMRLKEEWVKENALSNLDDLLPNGLTFGYDAPIQAEGGENFLLFRAENRRAICDALGISPHLKNAWGVT